MFVAVPLRRIVFLRHKSITGNWLGASEWSLSLYSIVIQCIANAATIIFNPMRIFVCLSSFSNTIYSDTERTKYDWILPRPIESCLGFICLFCTPERVKTHWKSKTSFNKYPLNNIRVRNCTIDVGLSAFCDHFQDIIIPFGHLFFIVLFIDLYTDPKSKYTIIHRNVLRLCRFFCAS